MPKFFLTQAKSPISVISTAKKIKSAVRIHCEENFVCMETDQLLFKSLNYFDFEVLYKNYAQLFENPENVTHYGAGKIWSPEEINLFLKEELQKKEEGSLYGVFSVHQKESHAFIGSMAIEFKEGEYASIGLGHTNAAEISYILKKEFWGRGYGKELATVGKKFSSFMLAMESQPVPSEVVATVHPENIGSAKILERVLKRREEHVFKKFEGNPRVLYFKPLIKGKTHFDEVDTTHLASAYGSSL